MEMAELNAKYAKKVSPVLGIIELSKIETTLNFEE
jgi:hypothetical protein